MGLFDFLHTRTLAAALTKTYKVKVHGIFFRLRKINPIDYVAGARAVQMYFDTYKTAVEKEALAELAKNTEKVKAHYRDVFMASVVEPKLCWKPDDDGIWVDNLFSDWDLANDLYAKIMEVTHGKKKLKSAISLAKSSLK